MAAPVEPTVPITVPEGSDASFVGEVHHFTAVPEEVVESPPVVLGAVRLAGTAHDLPVPDPQRAIARVMEVDMRACHASVGFERRDQARARQGRRAICQRPVPQPPSGAAATRSCGPRNGSLSTRCRS